jgi:MSHA pilin protein MshC
MMIAGIIAAIAIPRFVDRAAFDSRSFHDETLAMLRYAQKAAIAQRRTVCVAFSASSATLTVASSNPGSCDTPLAGPTGNPPFTKTAPGSASFSTLPANLNFDSQGRPSSSASIQVNGYARAITVEPETGYAH